MPLSKKRKKKGKDVKKGTLTIDPNKESNVSLQDLINVLAYQEYVKDGTIIAKDATATLVSDTIPVTVTDENGVKRQVGVASAIPGDTENLSIQFTDPDILGPIDDFSIVKEQE